MDDGHLIQECFCVALPIKEGEPLSDDVARIVIATRHLIERAADEVAYAAVTATTDRGARHITIVNGEVKPEGEPQAECVLQPPYSLDCQRDALWALSQLTVKKAHELRGQNTRVVWRCEPAVERHLCEDGLQFTLRLRMAWD